MRLFADRTGLEPATSAVTGRHSNQLNYRSKTTNFSIGTANVTIILFRKKFFKVFSGFFQAIFPSEVLTKRSPAL